MAGSGTGTRATGASTTTGLVTGPQVEPVTLAELKLHLRLGADTTEDTYLAGLITAAREYVENVTRRALITQTWDYWLDEFPPGDYFELPFGNLQSVSSLKYKDSDATETTMTVTTDYLVDINSEPGRIWLPYGETWPSFTAYPYKPITARFICGYGVSASNVPNPVKAAIKLLAAHLYENREMFVIGQTITKIEFALDALLASYRLWRH